MKTENKSLAVGLAVLILALLLLIPACNVVGSGNRSNAQNTPFALPEIVGNGFDGFEERTNTTAIIPAVDGIQLRSGTFEQDVFLQNPEKNGCVFVISLYLGDGTKLFETEPLYPGDMVETISTAVKLKTGVYHNAILVYDCYSADGAMTPLTRCELIVEINSL